ncbi:winged helix-turn-helix transcriptional regulator [Clostridium beijerinckii]|nr:winged helix-turn-helix transcriptional regulator [Clostridium beijerinckii]
MHRDQYNEVPPKVEYPLTEEGMTLISILEFMSK